MKLRNKKTGEVSDALIREKGGGGSYSLIVCDVKAYEHSKSTLDATHFVLDEYDSLAKLNEEWEDYEEPKEYWYVYGTSVQCGMVGDLVEDGFEQIGNYFETKEEAERAVEKLCAWKRLKDKGFRFDHWNKEYGDIVSIIAKISKDAPAIDVLPDMNLLFGGEE